MGLATVALETEEDEVRGVNTQGQLAEAEDVLQRRLRAAAHEAGVAMTAPDTVHLTADTKLGRDVVIEPYVVFGPGVTVEDGAVIRSFSHLEGATVGRGARVGPFARLCPDARSHGDVRRHPPGGSKTTQYVGTSNRRSVSFWDEGKVDNGSKRRRQS